MMVVVFTAGCGAFLAVDDNRPHTCSLCGKTMPNVYAPFSPMKMPTTDQLVMGSVSFICAECFGQRGYAVSLRMSIEGSIFYY
jgi:hypothetical protein